MVFFSLRERGVSADFKKTAARTSVWQDNRPIMKLKDSDPKFLARLVVSEIQEVMQEHESIENGINGREDAFRREQVDVGFLLESWMANVGLNEIDLSAAAQRSNGLATKSGFYDKWIHLTYAAGEAKNQNEAVEQLWVMFFSLLNHSPVPIDYEAVHAQVLRKNGTKYAGNYPSMYFGKTVGKKILTPELQLAKYDHVRKALRIVRDEVEPGPLGLAARDHLPFRSPILQFTDSEVALESIRQQLFSRRSIH